MFDRPDPGRWSPTPAAPATLDEVYAATREAQAKVDNANAYQSLMEDAYDRRNAAIAQAGGPTLENPWRSIPTAEDQQRIRILGEKSTVYVPQYMADKYDRDLQDLEATHPHLAGVIEAKRPPSLEVREAMAAAETRRAEALQRYGMLEGKDIPLLGSIPLVGSAVAGAANLAYQPSATAMMMAGSLRSQLQSPADLMAMAIGPLGTKETKSLVWNALRGSINNALGQAAIEPIVQANRAAAGLESGFGVALEDIAGAAGIGAALDVGFRAPVRAIRKSQGATGLGGVISDAPAELPALPKAPPKIDPDVRQKAEAGDIKAQRELATQAGVIDDPGIRTMLDHVEMTGNVDEGLVKFREEMRTKAGVEIDDGDLNRRIAGELRAAIDPDALPLRREPAAVKPAAEPLMDAEAARLIETRAGDLDRLMTRAADAFERIDPRISAMVDEAFQAGMPRIVAAVQEAIDNLDAGRSEAKVTKAFAKAVRAIVDETGFEKLGDMLALHSGRSSVIETATAMRRSPDLVDSNVSFQTEMMQVARALSTLDDGAWSMVARGEADPRIAGLVADHVEAGRQAGVLDQVVRSGVRDLDEARKAIADLEPERMPEAVRNGVDNPSGPETKAATERMEKSMQPEVEAARKAIPEPQAGQSVVDAIMQSAVVRRSAEAREAIGDAIRFASRMLPEGVRIEVAPELRDPATGALLDAQTDMRTGDIIIAAKALDMQGKRTLGSLLGHEGVHALVTRGLLAPEEVKLLAEAAKTAELKPEEAPKLKEGEEPPPPEMVFPDALRERYAKAYEGRANLDALLDEEAAAHLIDAVIAKRASLTAEPKTVMERLMESLKAIAERLQNWREGKGWQTAEDLINDIVSGDVAKREAVKAWMRSEDLTAVAVRRPEAPTPEPNIVDPVTGTRMTADEVESIVDMWRYVQEMRRAKKPQRLSQFLRSLGGINDDHSELRHMMGSAKALPGLVNKNGVELDAAARSAWDAGFLRGTDRPDINALLDALDEDLHGNEVFRESDAAAADDIRVANEMAVELEKLGVAGLKDEQSIRTYLGAPESGARAADRQVAAGSEGPFEEVMFAIRAGDFDLEPVDITTTDSYRGRKFFYRITSGGEQTGLVVEGYASGNRAVIDWIGAERTPDTVDAYGYPTAPLDPNRLGTAALKQLREAMRRDFPDVQLFMGDRMSGARRGPAARPDVDTMQSVSMYALTDASTGQSMRRDMDALEAGKPRDPNTPPLGAQREGVQSRLEEYRTAPIVEPSSQTVAAYADAVIATLETKGFKLIGRSQSGLSASTYLTFTKSDGKLLGLSKKGRSTWLREFKAGAAPADGYFRVRVSDHSNSGGVTTPNADVRVGGRIDDVANRAIRLLELERQYPSGGAMFAFSADRNLDALGYYSQALEAARNLKQAKGTPEQMLAQLKSAGVKDAEIEATGLRGFLDGKKSVTRDEIVAHLEQNRVGLREVQYGGANTAYPPEMDVRNAPPKWQKYSLDPSNPSYRETVLHLPEQFGPEMTSVAREMEAKYGPGWALEMTPEEHARAISVADQIIPPFQSGHFSEPNIVGHMMTSMTKHEGRPVYTIDQIQSDWGQKLRDNEARDATKIEDLSKRIKELETKWASDSDAKALDPKARELAVAAYPSGYLSNNQKYGNDWHAVQQMRADGNVSTALREKASDLWMQRQSINGMYEPTLNRLRAELRTAEAATPGHPLVNTTDQWTTTTLKRALRQAAEADAEYIAIPSGDTVLSYNPGDENGMRQFYGSSGTAAQLADEVSSGRDLSPAYIASLEATARPVEGIVPKNLRKLLQKLDKDTPAPQRVDQLETPSGMKGKGFTLFPLTPKVKAEVAQRGQAMFAFAGERAKTADLDALAKAKEMETAGRDRTEIWTETGWFKGVDGKWRFEIDDSGATLPYSASGKEYEGPIRALLNHPELMAAYPEVGAGKGWLTIADHIKGPSGLAYKNGNVVASAQNAADARTTMLHEIQHQVQHREGFANGSGGGFVRTPDDYARHKAHAGEQEAYAVEKRADMTPAERRARPPWLDYDVPEDQQIVRFADGKSLSMYAYSEEPPVEGSAMRGLKMFAIRAYHGSPHDFDKFDLSKIGTGEGAQAYGFGLYFAENEGVAKDYRKRLSPKTDLESAAQDLAEQNGRSWGDMGSYERQAYIDEAQKQGLTGSKAPKGRLYEVSIHADPNDFLDWDKPLSQQSEKVRGALASTPPPHTRFVGSDGGTQTFMVGANPRGLIEKTTDGYEARAWFGVGKDVERFKSPADARAWLESRVSLEDGYGPALRDPSQSARLREAGIPGIKYLDQGSRTAGEGSRNYVVFSDDIIEIVAKDGVPVTKPERDAVLSGMRKEPEQEPQSPLASDLQTADRLKDASERLKPQEDEGGQKMFALDMSQEARKARAEAMGFDASRVLYHGTGAEFSAFDVGQAGSSLDDGWLGRGIYLTTSQRTAGYYASAGINVERAPAIIPAYVRGRLYEYGVKNQGTRGEVFGRESLPQDIREDVLKRAAFRPSDDPDFSQEPRLAQAMREVLMERGYDGVRAKFRDGNEEIVIFDPRNIRSVNAAFDPEQSGSANLMYALRDPHEVINELERKSTLGKTEAKEIRKTLDDLKAAGHSDDEALHIVASELEAAGEDKKRVALLGEKSRQRLISDLVAYRNNKGEVDILEAWKRIHERYDTTGSYVQDLETARLAIIERSLQQMGALLKEAKRGAIRGDARRRFGSTYASLQNIAREAFGESTGDVKAKAMAQAWLAVAEDLRLRFNAAGGHIAKLEKWGLPQGHNAQALRDAGMSKWVDFLMEDGMLDRDRMVSPLTGRKLTDGELREALAVAWGRITTDGWIDQEITGQPMGRGALFNQHADHRFIHFKNADAWLRYAKSYANDDVYGAMMSHINRMARDIAHMERLGPNPAMMRNYIRNWMTQKAKSTASVESLIIEQKAKIARLAREHEQEMKDLFKGRQELLDELAEAYLDMGRVKLRSGIKRALGLKEEQAKRLAELDAKTRKIDDLLYRGDSDRSALTLKHAEVRQQITDMMETMKEAVQLSVDKDPEAALANTLDRVDAMWEAQRGALVPVSTKAANVMAIGRNVISSSSLGAAVLSSLSDPQFGQGQRMRWGEQFGKANAARVMRDTIARLLDPKAKWDALDSSIAMDAALSSFGATARENKAKLSRIRNVTGYINDRVLAIGLLTPWTDAGKAAHGTWLQLYLGRHAGMKWEKLPPEIQNGLTAHGFDAASWEQIRFAPLYDPTTHSLATVNSKAKQLRPKEIEMRAGRELAERYIAMIVRDTRMAVPESTVESRSMVLGKTRPGTVSGEIVRSFGQFKAFPLAIATLHLGQLAREIGAGNYRSPAVYAGTLLITSAFLGTLSMALKDMKDGRDPRRWLDEKTWLAWDTWAAAMLQSGGLGIYGDFFFSNVNRHGGGLASTIGGPMVDRVDNLRELIIGNLLQIYQGKDTHFGRESTRFLKSNTPGLGSWFFTSLAYQRIAIDQLQRMVDPKAHEQFRAQVMNRRRDYGGQEYFWRPGERRPERAPALTRIFATQ